MVTGWEFEAQQAAEQLPSYTPSPSRLAAGNDDVKAALHQVFGNSFSQKKARRRFPFLLLAAVVLLLLTIRLCVIWQNKTVSSQIQVRRLSGREEGGEEEGAPAGVASEVCEMLEEVGIIPEEEGHQHPAQAGPSAPPSEASAKEERPRKRKQKTRWLEKYQATEAQLSKKAKLEPSPPPQVDVPPGEEEADLSTLVEASVLEAIERVGIEVEEWGHEFDEETLWMSPPAASPESAQGETDEADDLPKKEEQPQRTAQELLSKALLPETEGASFSEGQEASYSGTEETSFAESRPDPSPPPQVDVPPGEEGDDLSKILEAAVSEAIEATASGVEEWGLQFEEQMLLMSPPAVSPESAQGETDETGDLPKGEEQPQKEAQKLHLRAVLSETEEASSSRSEKKLSLGTKKFFSAKAQESIQSEPKPFSSLETEKAKVLESKDFPSPETAETISSGSEDAFSLAKRSPVQEPQAEEEPDISEAVPSTSGAPGPARRITPVPSPLAVPYHEHKFYRLPRSTSDVQLNKFDGLAVLRKKLRRKVYLTKLQALRRILVKEHLADNDMRELMYSASCLLEYASQWTPKELKIMFPSRLVEAAARRFLVVDAIFCIIEVLGPVMNRDQWWSAFMAHVEIPEVPSAASWHTRGIDWRPLIEKFRNAIQLYGQGTRPPPAVIVELKRAIFCDPNSLLPFRDTSWNPWREDDDDFRRTSGSR